MESNSKNKLVIKEIPVRPVKEVWLCPRCSAGHMDKTGQALYSDPVQYEYACDECGFVDYSTKSYPNIIFKEILGFINFKEIAD